jgi:hypothetical protein
MRLFALAATVLLLQFAPELRAQTVPPPIIVPQVAPRFNDPGPQLTIPQLGNSAQQRPLGTGSQIVPSRSAEYLNRPRRHHVTKHRHDSRTRASKHSNQGTSSRRAPVDQHQPITSSATQEPEQTPADKKMKELDDALSKKMKGICRGC